MGDWEILENGEQVLPQEVVFEGTLDVCHVGIHAETNEHVVIGEGGVAIRGRTVLGRPASGRWNVDAVEALQVSLLVPNPENLRQAKGMPESLTKKIEVEGDDSKIQEQVRRFQASFASSKSPRAFRKTSVYLTISIRDEGGRADEGCTTSWRQSPRRFAGKMRKISSIIRANREDADKEGGEGKRKLERGEEKRNQDNKRRRLQL